MCVELLTVIELSDLIKVHKGTIYRWMGQGMPIEIQDPMRFKYEDVKAWLEGRHEQKVEAKNGE